MISQANTNMVTSDDSTKLSEILASSKKWNLIDVAKRDAWLLSTKAALREDPDAFSVGRWE